MSGMAQVMLEERSETVRELHVSYFNALTPTVAIWAQL